MMIAMIAMIAMILMILMIPFLPLRMVGHPANPQSVKGSQVTPPPPLFPSAVGHSLIRLEPGMRLWLIKAKDKLLVQAWVDVLPGSHHQKNREPSLGH